MLLLPYYLYFFGAKKTTLLNHIFNNHEDMPQ